jgi:hypothetical protein
MSNTFLRKVPNSSRDKADLRNTQASETETSAELHQTPTTLQGIRQHTSQNEEEGKGDEPNDRKWQKLAVSQASLSYDTIRPSGMRCPNVAVVERSEILGRKYQGFALEEAEQSQASLGVEAVHPSRKENCPQHS